MNDYEVYAQVLVTVYSSPWCIVQFVGILHHRPSQCGATAERMTRVREVPGSKLAWANWFFPWARKLS